ncbi:MAG: hypothetical protein MUF76_13375 [Hydrogenophaga sp.]|jgi:hypothetical protein|nr:hypothetical protein [Hydrogenophaga sp.]
MTTDVWLALLFFGALWGGILALVFWQRRKRLQQQEVLRAAAIARGWGFEAQRRGRTEVMRWNGSTDGTPWTLEYRLRRSTKRSQNSQVHNTVWWADTFHGPSAPVLFIAAPPGTANPRETLAQTGGFLASMAQKAANLALDKALDTHFGEQAGQAVDARELQAVVGADVPGFLVMATDPQQARWLLNEGWTARLEPLRQEPVLASRIGPWVLVLPRRVHLARRQPIRTEEDVLAMVRDGLKLVQPA